MAANLETPRDEGKFDFSAYPPDALFHERRTGRERRTDAPQTASPVLAVVAVTPSQRRAKIERRKRIDPTTFEKQYTGDELEFMNAMQRYKVQSGKPFPTHGEVLKVAMTLGYRRVVRDEESGEGLADAM